jgi:hypothetical protein
MLEQQSKEVASLLRDYVNGLDPKQCDAKELEAIITELAGQIAYFAILIQPLDFFKQFVQSTDHLRGERKPSVKLYETLSDKHTHVFFGKAESWEQFKRDSDELFRNERETDLSEETRFRFFYRLKQGLPMIFTYDGTREEFNRKMRGVGYVLHDVILL